MEYRKYLQVPGTEGRKGKGREGEEDQLFPIVKFQLITLKEGWKEDNQHLANTTAITVGKYQ